MTGGGTPARAWALGLVLIACAVSCGEKVPYPRAPGRAPPAGPGTPVTDDSPPNQVPAPQAARPVALVQTPEGTFLVSARPDGTDVAARKTPALAYVRSDGTVVSATVVGEATRAAPGAPESRFVRLSVRSLGRDVDLVLPEASDRPDLAGAARAEPDLAAAFYHRESLVPSGMWGGKVAYVAGVEGFLGGAHPFASRRLVVLDLGAGRLEDVTARFSGRDLSAEVLGKARETTCTRRPAGVAVVEGRGGEPAWVVGLAHDVESCAGEFRLARLPGPLPDGPRPAAVPGPDKDGALRLSDAVIARPVADWRLAGPGGAAVLLMGADRNDRAPSPWESAPVRRSNGASRELRFWAPGMATPTVLGRASAILSVQFLEGAGETHRTQEALDRL